MKLTEQQIAYFESFGFLILRQAFAPHEMTEMTRAADDLWRQARQEGEPEDNNQYMSRFIEPSPRLAWLAEDDRIYKPMGQLLGDGFIWGGSEGNKGSHNVTNDHYWHCDRDKFIGLGYGFVKLMIYLEPTTKETGALRVIPGSHLQPFADLLRPLDAQHRHTCRDAFGVEGDELPCVGVETQPGDLVLLNHYIYHGVYHKQPTRRFIALKYAAKPATAAHVNALRAHHQDSSCLHDAFRRSTRPRIQAMVEHLITSERLSATG
jgi:hypothetical protein